MRLFCFVNSGTKAQLNIDSLCFIQIITHTKVDKNKVKKFDREFIFHISNDWVMEFKGSSVITYHIEEIQLKGNQLFISCIENNVSSPKQYSFIVPLTQNSFLEQSDLKNCTFSNDYRIHCEYINL
jgi:hypothetical protein